MMSITLKQLIQNRKDLIEAHRKNNFTDGIHALLTDLYPDTAHFIYELLQNAEDMNATVVRFILDTNGIDFEHNGTKRPFNIADIDAITNIGHNSQKKDDLTSIGKFGVGFKAVFAYTATPIIHSGDYHFQIEDYFVPEFQGVQKVCTKDTNGVSWTKFSFPFNNPKKPANIAYEECLEGLKTLDSSAILFLQNIKKIEYMLPSGDFGFVERIAGENHHVTVKYQKPAESNEVSSNWLRFSEMVNITDDQGKQKQLSIAAAFALEYDSRSKEEKIVPVKGGGKTFIYFPAEKEYSGLRFHVNAPFASTVARDSVRSCSDNTKLIKAISQLIVDSLPEIKSQGLMNHSFFEVLPNSKDNLSFFYTYIFDYICDAFQKNKYLPAKKGGFVTAKAALMGPAAISNLLKGADMQQLAGIEKTWIKNAPQKNSNADNFIHSLDIQTYDYKDFAKIFGIQYRNQTEVLIRTKPDDWLKKFYILCDETCDKAFSDKFDKAYSDACMGLGWKVGDNACDKLIQDMQQTAFIKSEKGSMCRPTDIFILPPNTSLITKTTPIVKQTIILSSSLSSSKANRSTKDIKTFFQNVLGIREYGPEVEIEKLLQKYDTEESFDESFEAGEYFKDLLAFAKYNFEHNDINFSRETLFLYSEPNDDILYQEKASNLFLGTAYGNDIGEQLADLYEKHCLWDGYASHYNEKELQQFIAFVVSCGASKGLHIENQDVSYHPLYRSVLCSYDRRYTGYGSNFDYTIPSLEKLLKVQSVEISRLIWKTLEYYGRYGKGGVYNYTRAGYAPNKSAPTKLCESSLIYYLKQYAWIPDKQGKMHKPEDISVSDLRKDFAFDPDNKLLVALKIGSAAEKRSQTLAKLEHDAAKAGMHVMTDADFQEYEKLKAQEEARKEARKNVAPLSGQDLLKKQKKRSVPSVNEGDDFSTDGAVNNVSRRETNIEMTFRNAKQMKPIQRKLFARVAESTKEERKMLRNWYQGKCQMCNNSIVQYNRLPYFIATNIISTRDLSTSIRQTTSLAWNSLCLCPNCAAKYRVCSRDLNGLYEQIMQNEVIEGDAERIVLTIELDGKPQEIRYKPKHFLALKKVIQLIDEETKGQ